MDQAREYINLTLDGKHSEAEDTFKAMLAQRVNDALNERKRQVADQIYNQMG